MMSTLHSLSLLEALRISKQIDKANEVLDEMLAYVASNGERFVHAELVRIRGDLLAASDPAAATAYYRDAVRIARELDLPGLEQRAAAKLAEAVAT